MSLQDFRNIKGHLEIASGKGIRWEQTYKRPMGNIAHLRKQFKLINTYDYIITLIKRRKNTLLTL